MRKNSSTDGNVEIQVAVLSEKGPREENQDWMSWSHIAWGECMIVADGMGGYKGGALAAKMTVEGLERYLQSQTSDRPFAQALQEGVSKTNDEVYRTAQSGNPETDHMGSTLAVALISGNELLFGHVGDSRVYLVRKGRLRRLTADHTSVQRMVDSGMITEEAARTHPDAHILSRAIGSKPDVEIEIGKPISLEPGDGILLCSDGLSGYVKDQQIEKVVSGASDVQSIPKQLTDLATESGSDDNITIQFIRYGPSRKQLRRTALQDGIGRKLQGGRSRWIAASIVVLAVIGLAAGVRWAIDWWDQAPDTTVTSTPASPSAASQGAPNAGQPATANTSGTQAGSAPPKQNVADKLPNTTVASTVNDGVSGGSPTPAKAALGATKEPTPIFIFLRTEEESQQTGTLLSKLRPQPGVLPTRSDTDLDQPPLKQCFIFYPDPSLQTDAVNLAGKLDKILNGTGLCPGRPGHRWFAGPYGSRTRLQGYVQGQTPQRYLLIALPKKQE